MHGFSSLALIGARSLQKKVLGPSTTLSPLTSAGRLILHQSVHDAHVILFLPWGDQVWREVLWPLFVTYCATKYLACLGPDTAPWFAHLPFRSMLDQANLYTTTLNSDVLVTNWPLPQLPSDRGAAIPLVASQLAHMMGISPTSAGSSTQSALATDRQPRANHAPLLLPSYKHILHLHWSVASRLLPSAGSRLRLDSVHPSLADSVGKLLVPRPEMSRDDPTSTDVVVPIGVFFKPLEMAKEAASVSSPFALNRAVPMNVALTVVDMLKKGPSLIKKDILAKLSRITKLSKELDSFENSVTSQMHPDVRAIMKSKKTVLLEHLAKNAGIVDEEFFLKLRDGFPLVGHIGPTGRWVKDYRQATMSEEELAKAAVWIREAVIGKCRSWQADEEARTELARITNEELEAGFLEGPYTPSAAIEKAGEQATFARRFVINQKDKWRPIDDFTISRANMSITTVEKPKVDSLDDYLAKARFFIDASRQAIQSSCVTLPDGNTIPVSIHQEWRCEGALEVKGRCLDLANAYKQFAVHPGDRLRSGILVPQGIGEEPKVYFTKVLPFGATSSVFYFLRFSEMLKVILLNSLGLVTSCYFDDFPSISYTPLASVTQFAMERLLDVLGFVYSTKEHKRLPFSRKFNLLGVVVTFPREGGDIIEIANTPERRVEIRATIDTILSKMTLPQAEASSLQGRLGFLTSQIWSRVGHVLISALRDRANDRTGDTTITTDLDDALRAASVLMNAPPRNIRIASLKRTIWMFTDAASEEHGEDSCMVSSIGGVLLGGSGIPSRYFAAEVPSTITDLWASKKQPIAYAESLAALLGKLVWADNLRDSYLVIAIDNVAAQHSLSRFSSSSPLPRAVLRAHMIQDASINTKTWVTWVPSESNIADWPSRMRTTELDRLGASADRISNSIWSRVRELLSLSCLGAATSFTKALGHD